MGLRIVQQPHLPGRSHKTLRGWDRSRPIGYSPISPARPLKLSAGGIGAPRSVNNPISPARPLKLSAGGIGVSRSSNKLLAPAGHFWPSRWPILQVHVADLAYYKGQGKIQSLRGAALCICFLSASQFHTISGSRD